MNGGVARPVAGCEQDGGDVCNFPMLAAEEEVVDGICFDIWDDEVVGLVVRHDHERKCRSSTIISSARYRREDQMVRLIKEPIRLDEDGDGACASVGDEDDPAHELGGLAVVDDSEVHGEGRRLGRGRARGHSQ